MNFKNLLLYLVYNIFNVPNICSLFKFYSYYLKCLESELFLFHLSFWNIQIGINALL